MLPLEIIDEEQMIMFEVEKQPSETYLLDFEKKKVLGIGDGIEAMRQAIYLALQTERFMYEIYSWDYGSELKDIIGSPADLVETKIKEAVIDALMQDDRILEVKDFEFTKKAGCITAFFTVVTDYGDISEGVTVDV